MSKPNYVKPYPKEFREQVVKMAQVSERRSQKIAEESGTSPDSVLRWVKQADLSTSERKELSTLRCENRRLRMDLEILAKAAAWFARETDLIPSRSSHS